MQLIENIFSHVSLIRIFVINDIKRRYKNSVLGFMWSVLEPLLLLSVFVLVFSKVYSTNQPLPHYVLYLVLSLVMWQFFGRATTLSLNSILGRGKMVAQVYFPREILPLSSCIASFIMAMFELGIFFVFCAAFRFMPPMTIVFLPLTFLLEFVLVLGLSLAMSVLNVYYRDVQYIWGVLILALFFVSPIFYTLDTIPVASKDIILLNPFAQILEMAHNAALYNSLPTIRNLAVTVTMVFTTLFIGYLTFRRLEPRVAEEI